MHKFPKCLTRINVENAWGEAKPAQVVLNTTTPSGVRVQAWTPRTFFGQCALKGEGWGACFDVLKPIHHPHDILTGGFPAEAREAVEEATALAREALLAHAAQQ